MQRAAIAFVALFLVCLSVVLAGPAFELRTLGRTGIIDAGALPQAVVITVGVLAVFVFATDMIDHARGREPAGGVEGGGMVVMLGGGVLLLLAAFLVLWPHLGFPIAASAFMAATSALLAPPESRTPWGYTAIGVVSVAFCFGVWLAFTNVLGVPLR